MKIDEFFDDINPCKDCENYDDGNVYENGQDFHEFTCNGGYCLCCAELNGFRCFEKVEND